MRLSRGMSAVLLCAALLTSAGCVSDGLIYDSYANDYHPWDGDENRVYRQWEISTHLNHLDFRRRSPEVQRAYWGWRHGSYAGSSGVRSSYSHGQRHP